MESAENGSELVAGHCGEASDDAVPTAVVARAGRLESLRDTGLTAAADPGMERFARLVASLVAVPVALVSLVESSRQVFPGMVGLGPPWGETRQTPLSHSLCRHVVATGQPLISSDVRQEADLDHTLASKELGVVAYAGMPLTDAHGEVLGSLCAIDTRPREWTADELADLADLAAACSTELRLRIASREREQARKGEEQARRRADQLNQRTGLALARSQLLLRAADLLADTTGLDDVRQSLRDLVAGDLAPAYVGVVLVEDGRLRRLVDRTGTAPMETTYRVFELDSDWPSARAVRENRIVIVASPRELAEEYGPEAVAAYRSLDLHAAVCVPLPGAEQPLGALVIGWDHSYELDVLEQAVLSALGGYTARAVERAMFLDDRIDVARRLQESMLTDLPKVDGLEVAALYRPAAVADMVGGDWYDLYHLPEAAQGGEPVPQRATLAATIGDITGHDMHAAALMGQTRSMLRQADLDHAGADPAQVVTALEHANRSLDIGASGTLIHAHLRPSFAAEQGSWEMTWTNAGHPPPLLVLPDGRTEQPADHDMLLHPFVSAPERTVCSVVLPPGALVLLYTDGLVEYSGADIDGEIHRVASFVTAHHAEPLTGLLERLAEEIPGPEPCDDIALLALRVPELPGAADAPGAP
ncbi:GAF domain-containing SpoIIE family protein phosphatase [Streptomyces spiramenti]|uniref:SpoIIE family protein phosphatase n=1 Tax=Streptomyces spiramenti TaxID=2720606 RepID=A0ABX1AMW5_9ACTN|nr:SpoIIE family protein phosphatase [Streptomyces spiramenti]NJP65682.1 SpoIIE family protein phosphatase [Streptomyces spiramenti]